MSWFQKILSATKILRGKENVDFIFEKLPNDAGQKLVTGHDYLTMRVVSARIDHVRRWTSKFYGCVHSRVGYSHFRKGKIQYQTIVSPTLMKEMDPENLDRVIQVDKPILGPVPFIDEVSLELGLFSVRGTDLASPYIDLLTSLSEKSGSSIFASASDFVEPIKKGADLLFGNTKNSELEIGCDKNFLELETGEWALIRAPKGKVNISDLRIDQSDGRLLTSDDEPFVGFPYVVIRIESSRSRKDWMHIPELKEAWEGIGMAAMSGQLDDAEQLLRQFSLICRWSPDLVEADRVRLADKAVAMLPELQKETAISRKKPGGHPLGKMEDLLS